MKVWDRILGQRFGKIVVTAKAGRDATSHQLVRIKCDCGVEKTAKANSVAKGRIKSCGCSRYDKVTTHNKSTHPIYNIWKNMLRRCYNAEHKHYHRYGGRGIDVFEPWRDSVETFFNWALTNGWEQGLELDRENNEKGYYPDNCRFVTRRVNVHNSSLLCCTNSTGYRGVSLTSNESKSCYRARTQIKGCPNLNKEGFKSAKEAAIFRDRYILSCGVVAPMNFTKEELDEFARQTP